jgi:uncharacterized protein (DUF1330 family)
MDRHSMKIRYVAVLAMLTGFGSGVALVQGLHAKARPPVYLIADNEVTDPEAYARAYLPLAQASLKIYGAQYVAAGIGIPIDGEPPKGRVVVTRWDSLEHLQRWRHSPEYRKARAVGERFATFRVFAVEGVSP